MTVAAIRRRIAAKLGDARRARTKIAKRPFAYGDSVVVKHGPDAGTKGHILRVEVDSRGVRVSRCALDTDFGTCIRVVANTYLRRVR